MVGNFNSAQSFKRDHSATPYGAASALADFLRCKKSVGNITAARSLKAPSSRTPQGGAVGRCEKLAFLSAAVVACQGRDVSPRTLKTFPQSPFKLLKISGNKSNALCMSGTCHLHYRPFGVLAARLSHAVLLFERQVSGRTC